MNAYGTFEHCILYKGEIEKKNRTASKFGQRKRKRLRKKIKPLVIENDYKFFTPEKKGLKLGVCQLVHICVL
jgi:hypothetical protein